MNDDARRKKFEKTWQSRFAEFAALRDDDAGIAGWSDSGLQTRFRFFTAHWRGATAGALYLDVGCGAGTYSRWLAGLGLRVIGADYSLPALIKARQREAANIAYCTADASRLPFPDHCADGLLCFGVLQAVWDSRPFMAEAARVLKPGGELWVDALNASGLRAKWDNARLRMRGKPMHLRYESPNKLMSILRETGFMELTRHWLPIMPSPLYGLQPLCEHKFSQWLMRAIPPIGGIASHSVLIRGVLRKP